MLKVSDAFNSAFAAPDRELRARVTIGKTVYDSDDLTSINYDSGAMTGEQFSIGSTYMNSAKIIFSHLVEGLKQLDEVLVEFGVLKPDGTVEYVKMGTFIVDDKIQMDRNNNTTTIECMDRMTMLGGTYVSKLTYPARIKDVAIEIANMAGVKANETSFARLSENKINQPTGYTYRDAIGLIAQFQMGFALFDRDGLLDIRTLQDNSFKIDPNQYFLKGLVKNETFFKLNGISCTVVTTSKDENGNETSKTTVLQSGSSSGAQIKLANNVMTQDVLDRMYEALKFTNYYPFSLNWNGNPAVEAGDWLTVEDLQGNEFKVPNMSYTLTYNGGLTTTSKADTSVSSPATYSYGGSMSNIVNEIGGRDGTEGNHIYEGTEDQEPALPKEGDLWYKHVGPDTEEWIYRDGKWEFLTSTKTANDAADAADKASKEAEEAKKQANKAVDGANDAVAKAGFANDTATQAKSDAAAAGQQAKDALTSAGTAITDAKKALTNSSSAQADSAQARKDSATAKIQATNAATQANQAVTDATTAKADANTAKINATQAINDAATAKGQAANALGQANTAINNAANALDKFNNMQVGGVNLLLDTDFNNLPKYWTASGTVTGTFNGHNIIYCDAKTITGDFSEVLRQTIYDPALANNRVLPSRWYTLSFYSKGVGKLASYVYAKFVDSDAGSNIDGVKSGFTPPDGSNIWDLTDVWTRHTYTFKSKSSFTATDVDKVLFRAYKGNTVYICMPQLEAGTLVTDYSPAPEDVQQQFTNIDGELASKVNQTTYNVLAGTVDTVNTLAKQNQSTISTLATKTSVDTVNHTATTAQTLAQQNANELLNKANSTTVNTLTQRVTTAESTLKQTATTAQLALTQKDIDDINDTVTTQGLDITAMADGLKLKADSSTVSSLDGRVTNLSGQLDVQADKIAATVTANDVTGMLNGYATQTWTQSQIKTTADQINLSVSKVQSNLDNMQIGSRNLLIGTKDFSKGILAGNGAVVTSEIYNGNRVLYEPKLTDANSYHNPYNMSTSINADATVYTVSFYAKSDVNGMVTRSYFYSPTNTISSINNQGRSSRTSDGLSELILSNNWEKYWITWTTTPSDSIKHIILGRRDETVANSDIGGIYLTSPMFVEGNKPLPWSPAPEDLVTDVEFAELAVKVDGITATVASKADKTQITQLSDQIKLKADTTALNTLKGTVDKQGSEITLNTNSIKLKADQSSVNTLKDTVDKQGSAIDVNTKAIALRANQSAVDTLTGRVSTAEGKITVQADQIAQTVSKTELTTKLNGYATETWTQSQIKTAADSINLNVSKVRTDLSGTKTQFAALEVKVNGIQTTVSGKADQSQVTQLANSITSVIRTGSQQNMLVNSNFVKDTEGWIFTGSYTAVARDSIYSSYQSTQGIRLSSLENKNPDSYHGFIQQNISANEGTRVSYSSMIRVHTFPERRVYIELLAFDKNNTRIGSSAIEIPKTLSPETWTYFKKDNVFLPTGTTHISLGLEIQGAGDISMAQPMLTQDTEVGPYTPDQVSQTQLTQIQQTIEGVQTTVKNKADQSQVTQLAGQITSVVGDVSANSSQITQMKADINLRVKAGDVINQINISPEGILIDGKKVHITGQTSIDNAVIKDAMIANVKADKITAGTLNAANVNVINLNANNITTGTIKGANLSMNLNTGEILFQKGSIRSTNGNLNINIDDGSMSLTNSQGEGAYFIDGKIAMTKNDIWTNGAIHYGQLTFGNNVFGNALGSVSGVLLEGAGGVIVGNKEFNPLTLFGPGKTYPSGGGIAANNSFATVASNGWASIEGGTSYAVPFSTNNPSIVAGISGKYSAPGAWMPTSDKGAASFVKGKLVGLYAEDGGFSNDHGTTADLAAAVDGRSGYILSAATYARTYASGAQMTITANGVFGRISSASKYKLAIGEISTLNDEAHQFLSVKPKQWFDKSESEALADTMTTGNTDYIDDAKALPHTGFIAEDLYTAGLDNYVIRGNDGSIESIQYDRLPVLHHELIRELFNRLDAAEMEIYKLKQEVINNAN
ncbi:gp58-like family protein [Latilactobacillus sakei]|uniref:gp58-like family protein n=1 Tax=Latilactobacillus sakei TaxID=1599 RepID=UPI003F537474